MKPPEGTKKTATLSCSVCGETIPAPTHCGYAMHVEKIDGANKLVCWMGPGCGKQEIPRHCNEPMTIA